MKKSEDTKNNKEVKEKPTRRLGVESAENRHALLDAAEQIMREEGYAAVTSRHVANKAGLKPQLVYYYFRTMDDLFLSLLQRRSERGFAHVKELLAAPRPLHSLWQLLSDPDNSVLSAEFMALANHRKIIGDQIAKQAEQLRSMQGELLTRVLHERGIDMEKYPPAMIAMLIATLSQILVRERALGVSGGHEALTKLVEEFLDRLEPSASR
ncbi:MAG: TetR/AcrR family transcriptional regulator [Spongiibacteraceae bacterium]